VTTKDIVPVVKFDNNTIGDGKPGKLTLKLMTEIRKIIEAHCA
jgi:branched-subunit amino acid aminotransferase/4-amino-4-deoxychorismate lyase